MTEERRCGFCETTLIKRDNETPYKFEKRQFCSRSCGAKRLANRTRICQHCDTVLVRRVDEKLKNFNRRSSCSWECLVEVRQKKCLGRIKAPRAPRSVLYVFSDPMQPYFDRGRFENIDHDDRTSGRALLPGRPDRATYTGNTIIT